MPRLPGTPDLQSDGSYLFAGGGLELVVDPRQGAQVRSFSLDGKNALASAELSPEGATAFGAGNDLAAATPKTPRIDDKPYAAEVEGSSLLLTREPPGLGLKLLQRYRLDTARRSVEIEYTWINSSDKPQKYAPWELCRVPATGGLSFYPSAQKPYPQSTLKLNAGSPITWFVHDQNREQKPLQSLADGAEGWLANVNGGLLLVKTFGDTPEAAHAPGEGEIELYADYDAVTKQHRYVQLAEQGPYAEVAAGGSVAWSVRWFLRRLPPPLLVKAGNPELIGYVRGVIQ